uniref:Uncharacterized protein n=1 Tax=Yersinia enterocolitica W22703 TaxID=913028 RepID=F4N800_YEREN|nr:unknown protein [Yersinia enterocolitica W22703]
MNLTLTVIALKSVSAGASKAVLAAVFGTIWGHIYWIKRCNYLVCQTA